jgi:hypothetical protein
MEQRVNLKCCVKLQKLPTGQTPVHGVEIEAFPHAKETTDVNVQYRNIDIRGIIHFEFVPEGTTVNQTFYVEVFKRCCEAQPRRVVERSLTDPSPQQCTGTWIISSAAVFSRKKHLCHGSSTALSCLGSS